MAHGSKLSSLAPPTKGCSDFAHHQQWPLPHAIYPCLTTLFILITSVASVLSPENTSFSGLALAPSKPSSQSIVMKHCKCQPPSTHPLYDTAAGSLDYQSKDHSEPRIYLTLQTTVKWERWIMEFKHRLNKSITVIVIIGIIHREATIFEHSFKKWQVLRMTETWNTKARYLLFWNHLCRTYNTFSLHLS